MDAPTRGISYAMTVPEDPSGGRTDDDLDQHAGDRPGEGQFSGLRDRAGGAVLYNRALSRTRLATLLAEQPACVVAMEACAMSHHWGRVAQRHGHELRLEVLLPAVRDIAWKGRLGMCQRNRHLIVGGKSQGARGLSDDLAVLAELAALGVGTDLDRPADGPCLSSRWRSARSRRARSSTR